MGESATLAMFTSSIVVAGYIAQKRPVFVVHAEFRACDYSASCKWQLDFLYRLFMGVYDTHPKPFLERLHQDSLTNPAEEIYCAGFELQEWRCIQFAEDLIGWLPDYALIEEELLFDHANAYSTNLAAANWTQTEGKRLLASCNSEHLIDIVYVVDRGLINVTSRKGRSEDEIGGAITEFYFAILNFVLRESGRRRETPFARYVSPTSKAWVKLG